MEIKSGENQAEGGGGGNVVAGPVSGVKGEGLIVGAEALAVYLLDAGVTKENVAGSGRIAARVHFKGPGNGIFHGIGLESDVIAVSVGRREAVIFL